MSEKIVDNTMTRFNKFAIGGLVVLFGIIGGSGGSNEGM